MSEFKGTPGPWHIHDDHGKRWIETFRNDDTIAEIHRRASKGSVYSCNEAAANAKLIAAAPELLEALIDLEAGSGSSPAAKKKFAKARAAIAKATA